MVEDFSCILCGFSAVFQPLVLRYLGTTCLECDTASIKKNPRYTTFCQSVSVSLSIVRIPDMQNHAAAQIIAL